MRQNKYIIKTIKAVGFKAVYKGEVGMAGLSKHGHNNGYYHFISDATGILEKAPIKEVNKEVA